MRKKMIDIWKARYYNHGIPRTGVHFVWGRTFLLPQDVKYFVRKETVYAFRFFQLFTRGSFDGLG